MESETKLRMARVRKLLREAKAELETAENSWESREKDGNPVWLVETVTRTSDALSAAVVYGWYLDDDK